MLLEKGIKDTRRSVSRQTALFAVRSRDKVIFRLLLEKGLNPDVMSETFGLVLHHTVCYGWMEGASLIGGRANINVLDRTGDTVLCHVASNRFRKEMLQLDLEEVSVILSRAEGTF